MRRAQGGFTLAELLMASAIASVIAAGTMSAFVAAARMQRGAAGPRDAEAAFLAQQFLDALRNRVAADSTWFASAAAASSSGWISDDALIEDAPGMDPIAAAASLLNTGAGARRCYQVIPADCDGDGSAVDDCHQVQVTVCWNDLTSCPCP